MIIPLLQIRRPPGEPGWVRLVADLERDAERTVAALQAMGHHGELPVTILVDGATADRCRVEPGEVGAHRLLGERGRGASPVAAGEIDLDRVLSLWMDAADCLIPSPWLRGLVEEAFGRSLPSGAHVLLVDVDAAQELSSAVHPSGRGHAARMRNLVTLGWQRELVRWLLGPASPAHTLADLTVAGSAHRDLLRRSQGLQRLQPLQSWLSDLCSSVPESPPARASSTFGMASPLRSVPSDLPAPWAELEERLAEAEVATYAVEAAPPESPPERGGLDPRTARLLRGEWLHQEDVQPWRQGDYLGLFVHRGGRFLPGVHLFCDRIEQTAQREGMPVDHLGWMVLWHELTHWRLHHDRGGTTSLVRLRALDIDEVVCELLADRAVERGSSALVPSLGSAPRRPLALRRWRNRRRLLPYSWYPRMLVATADFDDEGLRCFALGAREALDRVEAHWTGRSSNEDKVALGAVESLVSLLTGATPPQLAHAAVEELCADPSRLTPVRRAPPVYLWRIHA